MASVVEPSSGRATSPKSCHGERCRAIVGPHFNTTILMVEHHMQLVMKVSDHIVVLASGRTLADGPPAAVRENPAVIEAYLEAV